MTKETLDKYREKLETQLENIEKQYEDLNLNVDELRKRGEILVKKFDRLQSIESSLRKDAETLLGTRSKLQKETESFKVENESKISSRVIELNEDIAATIGPHNCERQRYMLTKERIKFVRSQWEIAERKHQIEAAETREKLFIANSQLNQVKETSLQEPNLGDIFEDGQKAFRIPPPKGPGDPSQQVISLVRETAKRGKEEINDLKKVKEDLLAECKRLQEERNRIRKLNKTDCKV